MSDVICSYVRDVAHRFATVEALAAAVNAAHGATLTPGALRNRYRRWKAGAGAPDLRSLLGTGVSDFQDEETVPGVPVVEQSAVNPAVARVAEVEAEMECLQWAASAERPEGFHVKGVSGYYKVAPDGTRTLAGQWVKTQADQEARLDALAAACEKLAEPLRGIADPVPTPEVLDKDLLCVYPMGDPHLGMHAWGAEAGDDFDLRIAERNLYAAVDHLVSLAPPAKHALILNLGDFFHADSSAGTTTKGTRVDVDTRHGKVYEAGVRTVVRIVDRALEKHEHVTLRNNIGNHDENASVMLGICLNAYYAREPRVTVDTSPSPFTMYRHGRCLVATTHGNDVKHADLGEIMANDWPEDWGATEFRYWYIGHIHHEKVIERRGVVIEAFRTLAAKDSWHNRSGYRSGRDMRLDVLHAQYGLINRHVVGVQRLGVGA